MNARTGELPWDLSGRTKSPKEMEGWWKARKQTEMDKDLVKAYYGDREAFDRVRAALAATPVVGGEREALELIKRLVDNQIMTDEEILGDIRVEVYEALAAPPASPLRSIGGATDCNTNCRMARLDGVLCPDDSCDLETGVRSLPASPLRSREIVETGTVHTLKTWPRYFDDILIGLKPFEWRIDDRSFEVGDVLVLQEWEPVCENLGCKEGHYTGREIRKLVSYVFNPFPTNKRTAVMALTASPAEEKKETPK